MKSILILNQNWFAEDLRNLGCDVLTCGYTSHLDVVLPRMFMPIEEVLTLLPPPFKPDVLLYLDDGAPITVRNIGNLPCMSFFYSVDTHHMAFAHKDIGPIFDHVFVAQKDYISLFPANKSSWLPLWASVLAPGPVLAQRKPNAVFVGTMNPELNPERVTFVHALAKQAPLTVVQGLFTSYYPQSQIVLNQTVSGDLNFRVFEALGSGALLLTEASSNGLQDLFTPGQDLVTYTRGNVQETALLINHFLQNLEQAQEIAAQGELQVIHHHQSFHRAASILKHIQEISAEDERRQITERINNPLRLHSELLQLLVCALSFTCLQRENAREALDNALFLMQRCLSITPEKAFSVTLTRLSYLATFAFDFLLQSNCGSRVRTTLLARVREDLDIDQASELETTPIPSDIESTRLIIAREIARLHHMNISEK